MFFHFDFYKCKSRKANYSCLDLGEVDAWSAVTLLSSNVEYAVRHVIKIIDNQGIEYRKYKVIELNAEANTYGLNYDQIIVLFMGRFCR